MVDLKRNEHVGERSAFPYLTALVNCVLWFFYGISSMGSSLIIVINVFGAALEVYYLYTFLYFCEEDERLWGFIYVAVGFFASVGILMLFLADMAKYKLFFSWACAVWQFGIGFPSVQLGNCASSEEHGLNATIAPSVAVFGEHNALGWIRLHDRRL